MNIVWSGCHEEGLPAFKSVLESGRKIKAFITLDEAAYLKRSAGSRLYQKYCKEYAVDYYTIDTIKGDTFCCLFASHLLFKKYIKIEFRRREEGIS